MNRPKANPWWAVVALLAVLSLASAWFFVPLCFALSAAAVYQDSL